LLQTYLSNLIHDYIPTRTLRSSNKLLLTIPRMSVTMLTKSFKSQLAFKCGTRCHISCQSTKTVTAFKRALKTELFWNKLPPSLRVPCQSATSECSPPFPGSESAPKSVACLMGSSILVLKLTFSPDSFPRNLPLSLTD